MKPSPAQFLVVCCSLLVPAVSGVAQTEPTQQVFRLDGGDTTYAFGVNERGDLEPLYLREPHITQPKARPEAAAIIVE